MRARAKLTFWFHFGFYLALLWFPIDFGLISI